MRSALKRALPKAQLLSLCAMAWFVWVNRVDPKLSHESLGEVLIEAAAWVSLAWIGSVIITAGVFAVAACEPGKEYSPLVASLPGIWFAPAIILMGTLSPAGLAIGLVLVLNATRRLLAYWIPASMGTGAQPRPYPFEIEAAFLRRNSAPALVAAVAGQAGLVALLLHNPFWAAVGFAASIAVLIGHLISRGAYEPGGPPAMPHSGMGMALTFLLALALTTTSLQVGMMAGSGSGSDEDASGQGTGSRVTALNQPPRPLTGSGGGFDGVILKPQQREKPTAAVLLLPAPWTKRAASETAPMDIPFSGEYWMFQAPWRSPPPWSVLEQGRPTEVSFHTTNGRPMQMAADQKLSRPVELSRCAGIQVVISRVDEEPAVLELILTDSEWRRSESLGTVAAAGITLDFPIPVSSPLDKFDEMKLVYHRAATESQKSARIAIERFVIRPRG